MFSQKEDLKNLDLRHPIFAVYVNTSMKSTISSVEIISNMKRSLDVYQNCTMWFVESNRDEIVCVWDGSSVNRDREFCDLIQEINKKIDIMSESRNFDDFKIRIRDWRLTRLTSDHE